MSERKLELDERIAMAADLDDPRELLERISAEAERLVEDGDGPAALISALLNAGQGHMAPTAAERHHHAALQKSNETRRAELAQRSPVYKLDGQTLLGAPVGEMGQDGLARFIERLLMGVLNNRPSRVILSLEGFTPHEGAHEAIAELEADLRQQGVRLILS